MSEIVIPLVEHLIPGALWRYLLLGAVVLGVGGFFFAGLARVAFRAFVIPLALGYVIYQIVSRFPILIVLVVGAMTIYLVVQTVRVRRGRPMPAARPRAQAPAVPVAVKAAPSTEQLRGRWD